MQEEEEKHCRKQNKETKKLKTLTSPPKTLGIVTHSYNASTQEAEDGEGYRGKPCAKKERKKKEKQTQQQQQKPPNK
jgi:hypothetical protein